MSEDRVGPTERHLDMALSRALHLISEAMRLQGERKLFEIADGQETDTLTDEGNRILTELRLITSALTNAESRNKLYSVIQQMQGEMMASVAAIQVFPTKRWGIRQLNICQKCGWPWFSRFLGEAPPQCPKCKDANWQRAYITGPRDKHTGVVNGKEESAK